MVGVLLFNEIHMQYHIEPRQSAPGDTIALTSLVRDIYNYDPDIKVSIGGIWATTVFGYDHRVVPYNANSKKIIINFMSGAKTSNKDHNSRYLYVPHEQFIAATGLHIPYGPCKPSIILNESEKQNNSDKYAVVASGCKVDIPLKSWIHSRFQEVINRTKHLNWKQIGLVKDDRYPHHQIAIDGAENLLGKTTLRQVFQLISKAKLVLGLISLPMLVASAFDVPCVTIGGGLENPWYHSAENVHYLHTIGKLDCCKDHGCWRQVPYPGHNDSPFPENWICKLPMVEDGLGYGSCMSMISADDVVNKIEKIIN